MAEDPKLRNHRPAEPSFEERLAKRRPVTDADLDAMAMDDLTDEEWDRFAEALGIPS
jgi:hypothetical protein